MHTPNPSKKLDMGKVCVIAGAGMGLLSPALTVMVQRGVPVAGKGSATASQQFIRQIAR